MEILSELLILFGIGAIFGIFAGGLIKFNKNKEKKLKEKKLKEIN